MLPWLEVSQFAVSLGAKGGLGAGGAAPAPPLVVDDDGVRDGTQTQAAPGPRQFGVVVRTPQPIVEHRFRQHSHSDPDIFLCTERTIDQRRTI